METHIENAETFCTDTQEQPQKQNAAFEKKEKTFPKLPKLTEKDKRRLVKHAMAASLSVTALSAFVPVPYAKKIHTAAGLIFLGLCAVHTLQNTPKKK